MSGRFPCCAKSSLHFLYVYIKLCVQNLDEVHVAMETCSELRKPGTSQRPSYATGGKYGFSDKVIDG